MPMKDGLIWSLIYKLKNPGEWSGESGFEWEKLWEGIESSRDMTDPSILTCIMSIN
jgi:hypothetical protein